MRSVVSGVAGSVRLKQLTRAGIALAEKHGKRFDQTGKARAINDTPALTRTGLDLNELYDAHVRDAFVPGAKTKAMHMIFQFPKELVDPDDAAGMLHHARAYAERVFGPDAVFADRIDRDEKNRQVVDLFIAPRYLKRTKRCEKVSVSMTRDLKRLAQKHGHPPLPQGIGRAMQDELFEYFRDIMKLDGVQRGAKKAFAGPDWKSAEQQRVEELEEIERGLEASAEVRSATLDTRADDLEARKAELDVRAFELDVREAAIQATQQERDRELADRATAVGKQSASIALETAQAKLLLRAVDDDDLELSISVTGRPKMNETAMGESERMAYRATWSERMLELARFVANALQALRDSIAAMKKRKHDTDLRQAVKGRELEIRENAVSLSETNVATKLQNAQNQLSLAGALQKQIDDVKLIADAFMAAWKAVPEAQRAPAIRGLFAQAQALRRGEQQAPAAPATAGTQGSTGIRPSNGLGLGPRDVSQHGGLSQSDRDAPSR